MRFRFEELSVKAKITEINLVNFILFKFLVLESSARFNLFLS